MHSSQQRCQLDAITRFLLGSRFPASLPGQGDAITRGDRFGDCGLNNVGNFVQAFVTGVRRLKPSTNLGECVQQFRRGGNQTSVGA